jgi:hypothetical protein
VSDESVSFQRLAVPVKRHGRLLFIQRAKWGRLSAEAFSTGEP